MRGLQVNTVKFVEVNVDPEKSKEFDYDIAAWPLRDYCWRKKVWLRWTIIVGANPENCLKTTSIVGRLFANLGSEAKKSGIQQKTNIWDVSEGGREWKNFCDLEKLVNAKLPSCKGPRMGVHRNEEAAHSNLISFHQHLVDQTITLETCSTF